MAASVFPEGGEKFRKKQQLAIEALSNSQSGTFLVSVQAGNTCTVNDRGYTLPTSDPVLMAAYKTSTGVQGWVIVSRVKGAVAYDTPNPGEFQNTYSAETRRGKPLYARSVSGYSGAAVNARVDGVTRNLAGAPWPRDVLELKVQEFVDVVDYILPE